MSETHIADAHGETIDDDKRDFIFIATGAAAAAGAASLGWPLVAQMGKAADTLAAGSIEINLANVAEGQQLKMLASDCPDPQADADRLVAKPDGTVDPRFLVMVGVCTHFGCIPVGEAGDFDGWYCPCHGSHYDTSGRIRKGPAPKNMTIPDYTYISDTVIKVG